VPELRGVAIVCFTSNRHISEGTPDTLRRPVDGTVRLMDTGEKFCYLRVHHIGCNIRVCDVLAKFTPQVGLDPLEVQRSQSSSRTSIDPWFVPDDLTPQRFWEATNRLSEIALEELDDRRREVKLVRTREDIGLGERILCHPLSKVPDDLG
jgi:hypothetical protein